ncbi:MAG: SufS family cysteine desulfurase, partial [Myxococcota bacterium]
MRAQEHSGQTPTGHTEFDVAQIRRDFPILERSVRGKPLVYLDNAASAQKPQSVIDAVSHFYTEINSNVHRGLHYLSEKATEAYESARSRVQHLIGAGRPEEVIFVRGTTEAINLVAQSFARPRLREGSEILITEMEHHSNIVPWQLVCQETGASLRVLPIDDRGELVLEKLEDLLTGRTALVSLVHVSNSLGTVNAVRRIVEAAHAIDVPVLVDGAQAIPHFRVDVQELGCDFYAFSGHKAFGPTGIGALYGRTELLDAMPPYQGGGEMIRSVTFEKTTYHDLPHKFEAGTPNIAGAIGLGAAAEYLESLDPLGLRAHEADVLEYATQRLEELPGVRMIGTAREKVCVAGFLIDRVHSHDVGTILDREGIAVRAGHHCTMPVMEHFGIAATTRASFAFYNTREEVDTLV